MASYDDTATVSGSIVRVNDGADSVGLKNWLVTLPASLSGYSEVNGVRSGKNFYPIAIGGDRFSNNGGATHSDDNGTLVFVTSTGTASGVYINTSDTLCEIRNVLKWFYDNGYPKTISFDVVASVDNVSLRITSGGNVLVTVGTTPTRVSHISTSNNFSLYTVSTPATLRISNFQIEYGSTATSYEAYSAPTQYTASLGRTIYGGTVDLATGTGADSSKTVKLSAFTWEYVTGEYSYGYFVRSGNVSDMATNKNFQATGYINNGNPRNLIGDGEIGVYNNANAIRRPVIRDDSCTTLEQFLTKIADYDFVYETTNTPETFTFDPVTIETNKGSNTFWSDQGDSEVTYYKDGYGFTSVTIHKETPEGEPVEQTAKLHRIVYGGLVDVISGKAEPKNILLPSSTDSASTVVNGVTRSYSLDSQTWTLEGTNTKTDANWLIYNGANYVLSKELVVGDTYTYSHTLSASCYSQFTYKDTNGATRALGYLVGNANKNASVTFTIPSNFVELLRFQIGVVKTATSVSEEAVFQLEKASSKTEYAPYFDPFTFPPIEIATDEGENTLYADEGDSAIVYRKAVD